MEIQITKSKHKLTLKFMVVYILNCSDILFTYTFLKTGDFYEANPLMRSVATTPYRCILVKILFPGIILLILSQCAYQCEPYFLKVYNAAAYIILIIYGFINITHLYYLFTLIS